MVILTIFFKSFVFQQNVHLKLGILAGMSFVQGGGSFDVLCPSVFHFCCGTDPASLTPSIEDVPDLNTRMLLTKVCVCDILHVM